MRQPLASRIQVTQTEVASQFAAPDLLAAVQERVSPGDCSFEDRTQALPTAEHDDISIMRFLASAVGDAEAAGGKKLLLVMRTRENEQSFFVLFAMVHFGELVATGSGPIRFVAPGWLAWCRDDYFYASSSCNARVIEPRTRRTGRIIARMIIHITLYGRCAAAAADTDADAEVCMMCSDPFVRSKSLVVC